MYLVLWLVDITVSLLNDYKGSELAGLRQNYYLVLLRHCKFVSFLGVVRNPYSLHLD